MAYYKGAEKAVTKIAVSSRYNVTTFIPSLLILAGTAVMFFKYEPAVIVKKVVEPVKIAGRLIQEIGNFIGGLFSGLTKHMSDFAKDMGKLPPPPTSPVVFSMQQSLQRPLLPGSQARTGSSMLPSTQRVVQSRAKVERLKAALAARSGEEAARREEITQAAQASSRELTRRQLRNFD